MHGARYLYLDGHKSATCGIELAIRVAISWTFIPAPIPARLCTVLGIFMASGVRLKGNWLRAFGSHATLHGVVLPFTSMGTSPIPIVSNLPYGYLA